MISIGSIDLDNLFEGYKEEINYIYGPPGSGKTTLCKLALIQLLKQNKKVIFIDTENGFSIDRFKQLSGQDYKNLLDNLILVKVKSFNDQCEKLENLKKIRNISLVIIDSIGKFYRNKVKINPKEINQKLVSHLNSLREITKNNTPVLITNQIYEDIEKNKIVPVGGEMVKKFCKKIIELKTNPRKIIQVKPEQKEMIFEITEEGLKKVY